jgi:hypothetical protein
VPRGGRRENAGPKKGNINGVRKGSRTNNELFAAQVQMLEPGPQRDFWLRMAREAGGENVRRVADAMLAEMIAETEEIQSNVTPIDKARTGRATAEPRARVNYTHTHTDTQSNNQRSISERRERLLDILSRPPISMFRAETWVDKHWPSFDLIEVLVDEILRRYKNDELVGINSPAAILKDTLHEEIALKGPRLWHCPHCRWNQTRFVMGEATS